MLYGDGNEQGSKRLPFEVGPKSPKALAWSSAPLMCFLGLLDASSLTRLLAARMACFVPMRVPLPAFALAPITDRVDVFPLGGRLVVRTLEVENDFVALKGLEPLLDKDFILFPLPTMVLGLILALICPNLLSARVLVDGGERGAEVELVTPSLGTILLDLLLLPRLALLLSLIIPCLDPIDVKLSHLSREKRLPEYLPLSPFAPRV